MSARNFRGVQIGEIAEADRQFDTTGHFGAVDQHRNDRHLAFQRGLDLDPDRIGFLLHPDCASLVAAEPVCADQRHENVALQQSCADLRAKIDAKRNVFDIDEHGIFAVMRLQLIGNTSGHRGIGAAVRNGDPRHRP